MHDGLDNLTGLPVISLYNDKLAPGPEDLEDIDVLLFDIPDIGSRFYTYLWTMTHVMEACAAHQKLMVLADIRKHTAAERWEERITPYLLYG